VPRINFLNDINHVVKFVMKMNNFLPFCLFGDSQPQKTSEFTYGRQPVLLISSFPCLHCHRRVGDSCHKSYSPSKLPVEPSVNEALSACHVCPRLTRSFPAGHFVTSSALYINQPSFHVFGVAHMYVGVEMFLSTNFISYRHGVLLHYLGFLANVTEN
jgi:hypothetical protein